MKVILDNQQFNIVLTRLALGIIENHPIASESVILGLQPRGVDLSDQLVSKISELSQGQLNYNYGKIDITFYRDDLRQAKDLIIPSETKLDFDIEGKKVILVDDVLYTGRTIRAAMDALLDFGRPSKVELLILIDRQFSRELPVQPDYVGLKVNTMKGQKVRVNWLDSGEPNFVELLD